MVPKCRITVASPSISLNVDCLIDTGCLFSNFCKGATAKRLGNLSAMIVADRQRVVTLADGSSVSTVGSLRCNLTLIGEDNEPVFLKSIIIHILPALSFDIILGFKTIRLYSLLSRFPSLFSEQCLQVHNCTMCRQCLPAICQQERSLTSGATQTEVLLAGSRSGMLTVSRDCRRSSEGGFDAAAIQFP